MEKIKFKRKVGTVGNGSLNITIPPELARYINIKTGDEIHLMPDRSKHGNYIGIWNPTEQQQEK